MRTEKREYGMISVYFDVSIFLQYNSNWTAFSDVLTLILTFIPEMMRFYFLVVLSCTCFSSLELSLGAKSTYSVEDITTWLGYNISDIGSAEITQLIDDCSNQLVNTGLFLIENWITTSLSLFIQIELLSASRISRQSTRTIFQDYGDFSNYASDSVRNYFFKNSIDFIPRGNIEDFIEGKMEKSRTLTKNKYRSHIFGLYNDASLLNFLKQIIYKAYNDTNLYLSQDADGSVYGFVSNENDWFSWHFDESPFSCVYFIKKPKIGGKFRWVNVKNPLKLNEENGARIDETWEIIGKVIDYTDHDGIVTNEKDTNQETESEAIESSEGETEANESENTSENNKENEEKNDIESLIHTLDAPENSMYCFFGNQTLHDITKVHSNDLRAALVMTYANDPNFQHSGSVRSLNDWSKKDKAKHEL